MKFKSLYLIYLPLVLIASLYSCMDPIKGLNGKDLNLLVVDGLVTNLEGPYNITLRRTSPDIYLVNDYAENSDVSIIDSDNIQYSLEHLRNGKYQTPSSFRAIIGKSYKLVINIGEKHYESSLCLLHEPSCIDELYFEKGTGVYKGKETPVLKLKVNGDVCSEKEAYLRWRIKEDWKIKVERPESVIMVAEDSFVVITDPIHYCYKSFDVNNIALLSTVNKSDNNIVAKEIYSSSTAATDRYTNKYRATVYQYTISKDEYIFGEA